MPLAGYQSWVKFVEVFLLGQGECSPALGIWSLLSLTDKKKRSKVRKRSIVKISRSMSKLMGNVIVIDASLVKMTTRSRDEGWGLIRRSWLRSDDAKMKVEKLTLAC